MASRPLFEPLGQESLSDRTFRELREAIVAGTLAPGERFRDGDIASQFGVSRTPVREALKRLADQRLVEMVPGASTRVTLLSPRAAAEAFPILATLHALAIRLASTFLEPAHMKAMRAADRELGEALKAEDVGVYIELDARFHAVAIKCAGNAELEHAIEQHSPTVQRLMHRYVDESLGRAMGRGNRQIVALLREQQIGDAAAAAEEDWTTLGELLVERLVRDERAQ